MHIYIAVTLIFILQQFHHYRSQKKINAVNAPPEPSRDKNQQLLRYHEISYLSHKRVMEATYGCHSYLDDTVTEYVRCREAFQDLLDGRKSSELSLSVLEENSHCRQDHDVCVVHGGGGGGGGGGGWEVVSDASSVCMSTSSTDTVTTSSNSIAPPLSRHTSGHALSVMNRHDVVERVVNRLQAARRAPRPIPRPPPRPYSTDLKISPTEREVPAWLQQPSSCLERMVQQCASHYPIAPVLIDVFNRKGPNRMTSSVLCGNTYTHRSTLSDSDKGGGEVGGDLFGSDMWISLVGGDDECISRPVTPQTAPSGPPYNAKPVLPPCHVTTTTTTSATCNPKHQQDDHRKDTYPHGIVYNIVTRGEEGQGGGKGFRWTLPSLAAAYTHIHNDSCPTVSPPPTVPWPICSHIQTHTRPPPSGETAVWRENASTADSLPTKLLGRKHAPPLTSSPGTSASDGVWVDGGGSRKKRRLVTVTVPDLSQSVHDVSQSVHDLSTSVHDVSESAHDLSTYVHDVSTPVPHEFETTMTGLPCVRGGSGGGTEGDLSLCRTISNDHLELFMSRRWSRESMASLLDADEDGGGNEDGLCLSAARLSSSSVGPEGGLGGPLAIATSNEEDSPWMDEYTSWEGVSI